MMFEDLGSMNHLTIPHEVSNIVEWFLYLIDWLHALMYLWIFVKNSFGLCANNYIIKLFHLYIIYDHM